MQTVIKTTEPMMEARNGSDVALGVYDVTKLFLESDDDAARVTNWRRFVPKIRGKKKAKRAVNRVSFEVKPREIFGVLGPNGSGKSTLIRMLATLLVPDAGRLEIFGLDMVRDPLAARRRINRVSVEASFFKSLSTAENLLHGARLYGLDIHEADNRARDALRRLGFEMNRMDKPVSHLSRGQQQKVAIARAFITRPKVLLLDEPTTGLDPQSKRDVQKFVRFMRDEHDTTVLLTTHDMAEAEHLCDRILILNHGKRIALDTAAGLKALAAEHGPQPTLEDVFIEMTGKTFEEAEQQE